MLPLLKNSDKPYPVDGNCMLCGKSLEHGSAYLSGGALLMDRKNMNNIDTDRLKAFLNIGYHGKTDAELADVTIIDDLDGGQFDIVFCTFNCMRKFFNKLIDITEGELRQDKVSDSTSAPSDIDRG